jgi:hypothetical protein
VVQHGAGEFFAFRRRKALHNQFSALQAKPTIRRWGHGSEKPNSRPMLLSKPNFNRIYVRSEPGDSRSRGLDSRATCGAHKRQQNKHAEGNAGCSKIRDSASHHEL